MFGSNRFLSFEEKQIKESMKYYKVLLTSLLCLLLVSGSIAQPKVKVLQKKGKVLDYFQFLGHSNKALLKKLNNRFCYRQLLLDSFTNAPYDANGEVRMYPNRSNQFLENKFKETVARKNNLMLASVRVQVGYNNDGILNLMQSVSPEGLRKLTNSVTSGFSYFLPCVCNLLNGKEWHSLSDFMNADGVRWLHKIVTKTIQYRAKQCCPNNHPLQGQCRSAGFSYEDSQKINFKINNTGKIFTGFETYYFYFDKNGLVLNNNRMMVAIGACFAPSPDITIPYAELLPWCLKSASNPVYLKAQKARKNAKIMRVKVAKTYILGIGEEPKVTTPYIIKNDKVSILAEDEDQVLVYYLSPFNIVFTGWVAKKDLE